MRLLIVITALLLSVRALAWETDQYTLPTQPLAETGAEVSTFVYHKLQESLRLANQKRANYPDKIRQLKIALVAQQKQLADIKPFALQSPAGWQKDQLLSDIQQKKSRLESYQQDFKRYQTQQWMAELVANKVGRAIAVAEKQDAIWGNNTQLTPYTMGMKADRQVLFYPDRLDTVYAYAGFHRLLHASYFILSSTIKLYDTELGMDKLGHLFNEGFQYYLLYQRAKQSGATDREALQKAVNWGMKTEDSYYGSWVSGIYSNADMASNYAGLHFYLNLFAPLTLNGTTYPPILDQDKQGNYHLNPVQSNQPEQLLKRFISHHMNEALNPSSLEYLQYVVVKEAVKNRCPAWLKKYPDSGLLSSKTSQLIRWNGDDYGFDAENTISILASCF
ncbi:hypothetical protein [Psychromonas hadalis]|uniref:hypothetical protein n=1 Tax=Psychromonas hadalis TaxID=211669 RepID=UPI0003B76F44|nr:hypothetical protein [Psychromonas hadalis]